MSHRFLFPVTGIFLLIAELSSAEETAKPTKPSKPTADRVKLVRQMYEKLPCEIIGFAEPAKKVRLLIATDGGTMWVKLLDAKDRQLDFFVDRKIGTKTPDAGILKTKEGHVRLSPRGPEESAVYGLLLRLPKEDRTKLDEVLKVLDQRFAGAMPVAFKYQ